MVTTVTEGRSGSDAFQVDYPDINSCITVTAVKGQALVGAHFVLPVGSPPERAPALVWQKLKAELQLVRFGTVSAVYVLGSLGTWTDELLPYHWPADFRRDLAALFGHGMACFKWDSQADSNETRLIRVNRDPAGTITISYGKYEGGHIVGGMHVLPVASLQAFSLGG